MHIRKNLRFAHPAIPLIPELIAKGCSFVLVVSFVVDASGFRPRLPAARTHESARASARWPMSVR